jgi:hypothetical protein
LITDARRRLRRRGVVTAIQCHDSSILFDWLAEMVSFQGIANSVAADYIRRHGTVRWHDILRALAAKPSCPKLSSYWQFEACGYRKSTHSCLNPRQLARCPLPTHNLRNGRLNQTAYSLFLFIRDVAERDIVAWLDTRLAMIDLAAAEAGGQLHRALLEPFGEICGISNKVASMALSPLLLAGDPARVQWVTAGTRLIAVDWLVHNFLYRTGIIQRLGEVHPYGTACYRAMGCAAIIDELAKAIDARRFNPAFPRYFPRFVQHALWRFCAEEGLNECNGHQIDDRRRCDRAACPVFPLCRRVPLKPLEVGLDG